ncbi:MAG: beta-N-acetylhexosaminidase [Zetaproteobacteria bacterium CG_4_9_14_3_um_filter_49_83]|nr:MAG: glycoside hydrolase family 3 [Zetaproteobacteria bacterium CG1_02_49_23]PIQ34456.1 MAG: beta-N-acetylhexosaminidase [Zetaproteobacteria bacterium CG17_big_fil_post_rev_8_21_14_2_50_50_13]PIV29065.1 MAG: beta-N-acetylhexosaminidase [Zetaproteobacteria bacterium CG02_land_8_20_14_3_00_50_9]PIY56439.1 MAG: beta-N-acetylhexosaminidase [Zetaproteobacteria bacterium CG_4_10_14_0_8_um_filter_49_80]PJA34078.1 MAG: beta-N-acetylhexosaminidase [Zetaproteobacteria bacterium CG_4_9_14_3_um_filter_4
MYKQLLIGLESTKLTETERRRLSQHPPKGVILFARNIASQQQVTNLLKEVRHCTGEATWAAIDEEGGRVNRIPWPPFNQRHQAAFFGAQFPEFTEKVLDSIYADAQLTGEALAEMGFTHNCAPVLDVFHPSGHNIIGERSFSNEPEIVVACGAACLRGLKAAGIDGVGKHFPGHGRANADSHLELPTVEADIDTLTQEAYVFSPRQLPELSHIMTAHVRYPAISHEITTFSPLWLNKILRSEMGFRGLIWSDDLCMKGTGENSFSAALKAHQAGCNILLICEPKGVMDFYETCGF